MNNVKLLIAGRWVDGEGGDLLVKNPASGETIARVSAVTPEQVNHCIEEAERCFPEWASLSPMERGRFLRDASETVRNRADEIARLMTMEQGKPFAEARGEVDKGASILRYYAEEGERVYGRIIANEDKTFTSYVEYEPVGVSFAISPWNYPIELLAWKVGGALAAGCPLIAKVPSLTPLSPLAFIRAVADTGLPAGVLSGIAGRGADVGDIALRHPAVKKVAFTGSTDIGRGILADTVSTLKKVSLELGGSLPMVVCEDADLGQAVKGAVRRSFRNMGQICIAINRIYVHRSVYDEFIDRFAEASSELVIGDGLVESCDVGPMATEAGREKVQSHIADALGKGARLCCGGGVPEGEKFAHGLFFQPTVIADVDHSMLVMQEETFGPLAGVMPYGTREEAITLANQSPYGLAAIVYTRSIENARVLSREIHAGNIAINNVDAGVINAPYGGWKDSGFGYEHGPEGLYEYLRAKHIRVNYGV